MKFVFALRIALIVPIFRNVSVFFHKALFNWRMNVFCPPKYFVIKLHVLIHVDVMLLDEPWASDDKENKKPSEPSEEDTCLIEDLPVVCNEVRVHTFFIMVVL